MQIRTAALALPVVLLLAACGGGSTPTQAPATPVPATEAPAATPEPATEAPAATTAAATGKVNANTATAEELVAALEAAGVANADRWADEIQEYRPYDTADPDFQKLRDELAKYNPGEDVIDQIISVLEP